MRRRGDFGALVESDLEGKSSDQEGRRVSGTGRSISELVDKDGRGEEELNFLFLVGKSWREVGGRREISRMGRPEESQIRTLGSLPGRTSIGKLMTRRMGRDVGGTMSEQAETLGQEVEPVVGAEEAAGEWAEGRGRESVREEWW